MTREEMFRKAVKAYFKGLTPDELKVSSGKRPKYTKKYFDSFGEEQELGKIDDDPELKRYSNGTR